MPQICTQPTYLLKAAQLHSFVAALLQLPFSFIIRNILLTLPYVSPWITRRFVIQLQRMVFVLRTVKLIHSEKMIFIAEDILSYSPFVGDFQLQPSVKSFLIFIINTR